MRQQPITITWKITCDSPEDAEALQQWIASRIDLGRVITDTVRTVPAGVERVETVQHRLGDYFADVRTAPSSAVDRNSFQLVFVRRTESESFWRDLMVNLLQETAAAPQKSSAQMESKSTDCA